MNFTHEIGEEPLPGYRLLAPLGSGAFGEVWKSSAPGGTEVALKFIGLDGGHGLREVKSLELVKTIRHPNLCTIFALWARDANGNILEDDSVDLKGLADSKKPTATDETLLATDELVQKRPVELIIAMALGEKTLADRLNEVRAEGIDGIPPEELFEYMEAAARAIDHLNSPRHDLGEGLQAIQHCDIKPQNILIVGDTAQVCDFGIARRLGNRQMTQQGGLSLYWAAPELFDKQPSASTDQYSLALTYYHARTGRLPFSGAEEATELQIMRAHTTGRLDFSALPEDEQAVVARATSLEPERRYEKTIDMIRAMRRAYEGAARQHSTVERSFAEAGMEIVPGYRLVRRIAGSVGVDAWEARDKDGKPCAVLIRPLSQRGDVVDSDALNRIMRIEHPHVTQMRGYWLLNKKREVIDPKEMSLALKESSAKTLVIAGDLAPKNLLQRLEECRKTTGPGIPREELSGYLRAIATGLDALNSSHSDDGGTPVSIQHCNLRPTNILLFDDGLRIGNFALARVIEGDRGTLDDTATLLDQPFCAPELADGRLTRWSDQYSFAITYVQLRTGSSPFDAAASTTNLVLSKQRGLLRLDDLGKEEAAIVARATATDAEQRFANCQEFVQALEHARLNDRAAQTLDSGPEGQPTRMHTTVSGSLEFDVPADRTQVYTERQSDDTLRDSTVSIDTDSPAPATSIAPALAPTAVASRIPAKWLIGGTMATVVLSLMFGVWTAHRGAATLATRVQGLVEQREYRTAGQVIHGAGSLQSMFVDTAALQQRVTDAALANVQVLIEDEQFDEAFGVCEQLTQVNSGRDTVADKEMVRAAGYSAGLAHVGRQRFAEAASIRRQLAEQFPRDVGVIGLGSKILQQGIPYAQGLLSDVPVSAENLLLAGDFYVEFNTLANELTQTAADAAGVAEDADHARELRGEIVRQGDATVRAHLEQSHIGPAVRAVDALREHFADDSLVVPLDDAVVEAGIKLADEHRMADSMIEVATLLGELLPWETRFDPIESLDQQVFDWFRQRVAEDEWDPAITSYHALAAVADGQPRVADFLNELFAAASKSIELHIAAGDLDRAETVRVTLFKAFGDDDNVRQLRDVLVEQAVAAAEEHARTGRSGDAGQTFVWLNRRFSDDERVVKLATNMKDVLDDVNQSMGPTESIEASLGELHARIDQDRLAEAREIYRNAQSILLTVDDPALLASRMSLALARIEAHAANWSEAQTARNEVDASLLDDPERGLLLALGGLVVARVVDDQIPEDMDLATTTTELLALQSAAPDFTSQSPFRDEATAIRLLVRSVASRVLASVEDESLSAANASRQLAAVATLETLLDEQQRRAIAAERRPAEVYVALLDREISTNAAIEALESLQAEATGLGGLSGPGLVRVAELLARRTDLVASPEVMKAAIEFCQRVRADKPAVAHDVGLSYTNLVVQQVMNMASTPREPNWETLQGVATQANRQIESMGGVPRQALVQACLAECMVAQAPSGKLSPDDWKTAHDRIESARLAGLEEPEASYVGYVEGIVLAGASRGGDLSPSATRILAAYDADSPAGILNTPYRRQRAIEVLFQAAAEKTKWPSDDPNKLDVLHDPLPVASEANRVFPWLVKAWELSDRDQDKPTAALLLNLAAAAFYKEEPQIEMVHRLTATLLDGSAESAELLLLRAQALQDTDQAASMLLYDRALQRVNDRPEFISAATYRRLLQPALDAGPLPELPSMGDDARKAVARLLAAKALLVRSDAETSQNFEDPKQAEFEAYDAAVSYDPDNADYRIHRGLVRFDRPGRTDAQKRSDVDTALRDDLKPVLDESGDNPPATAFFLNARISYVRSSIDTSISRDDRTDFLLRAMHDYERAVESDQLQGEDLANCLIGASTTNVSLANFTVGDRSKQRAYLVKSRQWAERAATINPRPHPEYAYQALGNAEEDFGWLLAEYEHYCAAISAFEAATITADNAGLPAAQSLLNTGRCRYKMLNVWTAFKGCGSERSEEIRRGMSDLQRALDEEQLDDQSRAKALSWQAKISVLDKQFDDAEALQQQAVETADPTTPDWVTHQIDWAQIALAHGRYLASRKRPAEEVAAKYELARSRGRVLLDENASTSAVDRQRAVQFIATCFSMQANHTAALNTYREALPNDLADADETHVGLLIAMSRNISSSPELWTENRELCEQSARRAVELAETSGESFREAQARAAAGMHAARIYRINPSRETAEAVRRFFEKALELEDRLDLTWYWRYQLARTYADMIVDRTKFTGDTKALARQAVGLLEPLVGEHSGYVQTSIRQRVDQLLPKLRAAAK